MKLLLLLFLLMAQVQCILPDQVDAMLKDGHALLLDVREPQEIEELGTLPGYVNIPIGQLEQRLDELPKDRLILTA